MFPLLIYGYLLFLSPEYRFGSFNLPIRDEREFDKWVAWSQMYRIYRLLLALYAMIQVFNFLLIASNHLPSLGILIETISASKEDLFMFFCFSQLIFVMAVVGFYYLFGFKDHYFDTMMRSYTTLC